MIHPAPLASRPQSAAVSKRKIPTTIERKLIMPRASKGHATRKARKRVMKAVSGHRGQAGKQYHLAKEARTRADVNATKSRKLRKRDFRGMWITRLSAACRMREMRYSDFINGCKKAGIALNRKMLSEVAISDPAGFDTILAAAKAAL
jgi:large subunit ribosomal protein L20